jgi:hypothetical protein
VLVLRGAPELLASSRPALLVEFDQDDYESGGWTRASLLEELDRHAYVVFGLSRNALDMTLHPRRVLGDVAVTNLVAVAAERLRANSL